MKVFISYRRDDTPGYNVLLARELGKHVGKNNIFMDLDSVRPGIDYRDQLRQAVQSCDVLIAMIGKQWLTTTDEEGRHRLEQPDDWVRLEIAAALEREHILVIPALVRGATMPRAQDLPEPLQGLAFRHAIELSDSRFQFDVERLAKALHAPRAPHPPRKAALWRGLAGAVSRRRREAGLLVAALLLAGIAAAVIVGTGALRASAPVAPPFGMAPPGQGTQVIKDPLTDASLGNLMSISSLPQVASVSYAKSGYTVNIFNRDWLAQNGNLTVPVSNTAMADGSIAVDARLTGDPANRDVLVDCQRGKNSGYALYVYPSSGSFSLQANTSNGWAALKRSRSEAIRPGMAWNRLQLSCIGGTVTAAINGKVVASIARKGNLSVSGSMVVGLGQIAPEPNVQGQFANLEVTTPKILYADSLTAGSGKLPGKTAPAKVEIGGKMLLPWGYKYYGRYYWLWNYQPSYLRRFDELVYLTMLGKLTDGSISVDAQLYGPVAGRDVRVECRTFRLYVDPAAQFFDLLQGKKVRAQGTLSAINKGTATNRLRLTCMGRTVTAVVNGVVAAAVSDSKPAASLMNFAAGTYQPEATSVLARFQNLRVTTP